VKGVLTAVSVQSVKPKCWRRLARSACLRPSPCLLAIPAFERIAGLYNRHLNSNRGYAYANDSKVKLRALTDHGKD